MDGVAYQPAWEVTQLEVQLCEELLAEAFTKDTSHCEMPGKRYSLSWTAVFQALQQRRLLVFHSIVSRWLESTHLLARHTLNWKVMDGLVLVIDPDQLQSQGEPSQLSAAEIYSRLLRVIEEYCVLSPGQPLPCKVAVALVLPEGHSLLGRGVDAHGGIASLTAETLLHQHDPALIALLQRTVPPQRLRFFGGTVPRNWTCSAPPGWSRSWSG